MHSEQGSAPALEKAWQGSGCPSTAWGPARHLASSKDRDREPWARSSWHQCQVQFAGRYGSRSAPCSAGRAGAGQLYQDGGQRRWVWGAWEQVLQNATMAGLEPPCPNHGLTKAGKGNREGAEGRAARARALRSI